MNSAYYERMAKITREDEERREQEVAEANAKYGPVLIATFQNFINNIVVSKRNVPLQPDALEQFCEFVLTTIPNLYQTAGEPGYGSGLYQAMGWVETIARVEKK